MTQNPPDETMHIDRLVSLLCRLHDRGDFINDPSPAVLAWNEEGIPQVDEVDLVKRSHVNHPARALAQLWSLMHGFSPRRRLDAARRYLARRDLKLPLEMAMKEHISREIERCFHNNRDFQVIQTGGLLWHVRRAALRDAHRMVLEDPDAFLRPGSKLIKDSRGTTVARTPGDALLKRFNLKKYRNLVKHQFSPSRARKAYKRAYHLEMIGIRTPRVIAYADRSIFGFIRRSYLLMEFLPDVRIGAETLKSLTAEQVKARRDLIAAAGRLVGLLHGEGFSNRDLKASNLLVARNRELWLVDLDGIKHLETVSEEVRVRNLRRMVRDLPQYGSLSLKERMIFLDAYCRSVQNGRAAFLYRKLASED